MSRETKTANWAKKIAEEIAEGRVGPVTKIALVDDIAAALDAAHVRGMEEAAEIAEQQTSILATVPPVNRAAGYADAIQICTIAIRSRIKEVKCA